MRPLPPKFGLKPFDRIPQFGTNAMGWSCLTQDEPGEGIRFQHKWSLNGVKGKRRIANQRAAGREVARRADSGIFESEPGSRVGSGGAGRDLLLDQQTVASQQLWAAKPWAAKPAAARTLASLSRETDGSESRARDAAGRKLTEMRRSEGSAPVHRAKILTLWLWY
jgi:hypothetical protein